MFVKICGLRRPDDVAAAVAAGADAVGFVLTDSPRRVSVPELDELATPVPAHVLVVGVFAGEPAREVRARVAGSRVQAVQLHGDYTPADFALFDDLPVATVRATAWDVERSPRVGDHGEDYRILDSARAGSGRAWDWSALATEPIAGRWMLAGGLTPDTVAGAVDAVRPWGVDVSSGVESRRGVKDADRIRAFVTAARSASA